MDANKRYLGAGKGSLSVGLREGIAKRTPEPFPLVPSFKAEYRKDLEKVLERRQDSKPAKA